MPTPPPPSRYRVVEQGRRLVVIDTLTGEPATHDATSTRRQETTLPAANAVRTDANTHAIDAAVHAVVFLLAGGASTHDGQPIVSTKSFYDDNAPRELVLDLLAQRQVALAVAILFLISLVTALIIVEQPVAIVAVVPLASEVAQRWLRRRITRWLDAIEGQSTG